MKISKEEFFLCAVEFLKSELRASSGDLKHICSSYRFGGGTYLEKISGVFHTLGSIGNEITTTEKTPANTITISIGKNKMKFEVDKVYKFIKDNYGNRKRSSPKSTL